MNRSFLSLCLHAIPVMASILTIQKFQQIRLAGDRLDFAKLAQITFEAPDFENFHGLSLAYKAGRRGGTLPTVFNAANERAVQKFLDREIGYLTITDMIEAAMEHHTVKENPTVEEILAAEQETYDFIESRW